MVLKYHEGCKHVNADSLSRVPALEGHYSAFTLDVRPEDLPCGGCKYCVRQTKIKEPSQKLLTIWKFMVT